MVFSHFSQVAHAFLHATGCCSSTRPTSQIAHTQRFTQDWTSARTHLSRQIFFNFSLSSFSPTVSWSARRLSWGS